MIQQTFSKHGLKDSFSNKGQLSPRANADHLTAQDIVTNLNALPLLRARALEEWRQTNCVPRDSRTTPYDQYDQALDLIWRSRRNQSQYSCPACVSDLSSPEFCARQDQLAEAVDLLRQGKPLVIRGLPRQGKTNFALFAALKFDSDCIPIRRDIVSWTRTNDVIGPHCFRNDSASEFLGKLICELNLDCPVIEGLHKIDCLLADINVSAVLIADEFINYSMYQANRAATVEVVPQLLNQHFEKLRLVFIVHKSPRLERELSAIFGETAPIWLRPLQFNECFQAINRLLDAEGNYYRISEDGFKLLVKQYGHRIIDLCRGIQIMRESSLPTYSRSFFYTSATVDQYLNSEDVRTTERFRNDYTDVLYSPLESGLTNAEWDLMFDLANNGPQNKASLPQGPFSGLYNSCVIRDFGNNTFGIDGELLRRYIISNR